MYACVCDSFTPFAFHFDRLFFFSLLLLSTIIVCCSYVLMLLCVCVLTVCACVARASDMLDSQGRITRSDAYTDKLSVDGTQTVMSADVYQGGHGGGGGTQKTQNEAKRETEG